MADHEKDPLQNVIGGEIVPANPWFETESGRIEFVKFQHDLEALGRYLDVLDRSLLRFLAEERAAFDRKDFLRGIPDGWSGEAEDTAREELLSARDAFPHFAFGSTLALCFMLREQFLRNLVSLEELRKGSSFKAFPSKRGESKIHRAHRFLAESWNVSLELDEETAQELNRLRVLRNKFIHAVSKELVPGRISVPEVSVTREDIDGALTAIGSYAWVLEQALEASYNED